MGAARNDDGGERSAHGPVRFDSFSESCDSREGSRKGPAAIARATLLGALATGRGGSAHSGTGACAGFGAKYRAGRSLHSGLEFYRKQRMEQEEQECQAARRVASCSAQAGDEAFHAGGNRRLEGSVSRHRGAQYYAEAATRWRAAVSSGDPNRVRALVDAEARAAKEDPAQRPAEVQTAAAGVFFDFPETGGDGMPARWGHAAASVGERLYVYGGLGADGRQLSDIHFFSITTNMWRPLYAAGSGRKDAPPPMWGHAVAAADGKIWVAGGHSGRKLQRKTFSLNTETLAWRALKESPHAPAAVADLTLTAVGEVGVVAFGGLSSKAASGRLHQLQTATGIWSSLATSGPAPSPRGQHSAVWDGDDSLVIFGGVDGTGAFAAPMVHVLSLSKRAWSQPDVAGEGPGPRARHCAAMLSQNGTRTLAIFGGTSTGGTLLNDVWLLDLRSWRWLRGTPLGASPTGRQGAAAAVLAGSRIALCGGLSSAGALDSLLLLAADFGKELAPLAEQVSLIRQSLPPAAEQPAAQPSSRPDTATSHQGFGSVSSSNVSESQTPAGASDAGSSATERQLSSDSSVAAMQLTELLRRRNVAEAAADAGRRAQLAERLFQSERRKTEALQAEVQQLRLVASEAEQAADDAAAALRDETKRAQRDQVLVRGELDNFNKQIEALKQQLAQAQADAAEKDRYHEAAVAAAARERVASDAAIAARSQCASLQRRCADLSHRLHAKRTAAAVASLNSGGTVREPSAPHDSAASSQQQGGRQPSPGSMRMTSPGRLPSIDELELQPLNGSRFDKGALAAASSASSLRVRTSLDEAHPGSSGDGGDVGGGEDNFLESLDSAFERWSMGDAATPPSDNTTSPDGTPAAGAAAGGAASHAFSVPPLRARSAPQELLPMPAGFQGGYPSRGAGAAAAALSRGRMSPPSSLLQRRRSLDEPASPSRGLPLPGRLDQALASLAFEKERSARMEALLTARQQAADERMSTLDRQLACLRGSKSALSACTPAELEAIEKELSSGAAAVRKAATAAAAREVAAESSTCSLCMERPHSVVFNCGHQVCNDCSKTKCPADCPFCRTPITARINVFRS